MLRKFHITLKDSSDSKFQPKRKIQPFQISYEGKESLVENFHSNQNYSQKEQFSWDTERIISLPIFIVLVWWFNRSKFSSIVKESVDLKIHNKRMTHYELNIIWFKESRQYRIYHFIRMNQSPKLYHIIIVNQIIRIIIIIEWVIR